MSGKAYLSISTEVKKALADGKPVVALESTIITHGMPYPQNLEMAKNVEAVVRKHGAVPATIAIMDGRFAVGRIGGRPGAAGAGRRQGRQGLAAGRRGLLVKGAHGGHDGGDHHADRGAGRHQGVSPPAALAGCIAAPRKPSIFRRISKN